MVFIAGFFVMSLPHWDRPQKMPLLTFFYTEGALVIAPKFGKISSFSLAGGFQILPVTLQYFQNKWETSLRLLVPSHKKVFPSYETLPTFEKVYFYKNIKHNFFYNNRVFSCYISMSDV